MGVDFGQRRIGLAVSDASGTLARPWTTVPAGATAVESAARVVSACAALGAGEDSERVAGIVVGVPKRLNGEPTDQTEPARAFARALADASGLPVREQDERLTSHEADRLLGAQERDWRRRKARLDAAAAAVILQEYLDSQDGRG